MKPVVTQTLGIIVIQHQVDIAAGLGHPVQAAVDANSLADIVILDKVHPRQGVGENEIEPGADDFRGKASLRQVDVVDPVRDLGTEVFGWRPVNFSSNRANAAVEEITVEVIEFDLDGSLITGFETKVSSAVAVTPHRNDDAIRNLEGLCQSFLVRSVL